MSSTDAAAAFDILRAKNVSLRSKLQPLFEFESGSNNPMAVYLVGILIDNQSLVHKRTLKNFFEGIA